jgi:hypothetical protein
MKQFILFISLCLSTNAMFAQVDYVRIHPASESIGGFHTVAETNSGGFLVAMDFSIWKIDQNYNVIWRKSCDSTSFFQLHELSNQNIAFSGYEFDENQNTYACIGVLDPNGNQLWSKRFATPM